MTELEIPLVMEDDGSVEKAEAYTKELEDVSDHGCSVCYLVVHDLSHKAYNCTCP